MEDLALHTGAPTVHWEDNTCFIPFVEAKILPLELNKLIFLSIFYKKIGNGLFVPKYEKYSVVPETICTKPCSGPIIIWINKWMTGFRFYPISDTEHYQLMRLHEFVVK